MKENKIKKLNSVKIQMKKKLEIKNIAKKIVIFSLAAGTITAFIITSIITVWEWIENPSGIFHGKNGTNWSFVYDTAISWFIPTFINVTLISAAVYLIIFLLNKLLQK